MYLIDTDVMIEYLKGYRRSTELLFRLRDDGLSISLVTYGEVYEGIYYGESPVESARGFLAVLHEVNVPPLTKLIMRRFGRLRGMLRANGTLIPDPDLLIAATAIHHGLTLVTRNTSHFERVPDLILFDE